MSVKKPCLNCIYYKACGESTRTQPCAGRVTKSQKKRYALAQKAEGK